MSSELSFRWDGRALLELDPNGPANYTLAAADSFLVSEGRALALELHRARFHDAVKRMTTGDRFSRDDVDAFYTAALAMVPRRGDWFPRLELLSRADESFLAYRHRCAPDITRAVTLSTHVGEDPRVVPAVKGPDIEMLGALRLAAQQRGVDDTVFVTAEGHIIDGAANAILWWREDTLCAPPLEETDPAFARVRSVTATSILGLAFALGVRTREERATPAELAGSEVWALNALHGIRMVTEWITVPQLAEKPGRIGVWRERMHSLRSPIGEQAQ